MTAFNLDARATFLVILAVIPHLIPGVSLVAATGGLPA